MGRIAIIFFVAFVLFSITQTELNYYPSVHWLALRDINLDPVPIIAQFSIPTNSSQPWGIAVSPSGTVWFSEQAANKIAAFFPTNDSFIEYPIPTPAAHPQGLAFSSDGSVWFTELYTSKLGRLFSGNGTIKEYSIPTPNAGPAGVIVDKNSVVWFAELFGNQIGQFNPTNGVFREYPLPVHFSGPNQLTFDSSGRLWFTATDYDAIGYLVPSDTSPGTDNGIVEFIPKTASYVLNIPAANGQNVSTSVVDPVGIVAQGNDIWFAEHGESSFDEYFTSNNTLEKIWTSRTAPGISPPYSYPNGIAVDSSGKVWVTEHFGNKIARFDPRTQSLTEFDIPCCGGTQVAATFWLSIAPDGRVWFTEEGGNKIGVVDGNTNTGITFSIPNTYVTTQRGAILSFTLKLESSSSETVSGTFQISGTSPTGSLQNIAATFQNQSLNVPPGSTVSSELNLKVGQLPVGTSDITIGFHFGNVTESTVIHLNVIGQNIILYIAVGGTLAAVGGLGGTLYARKLNRSRSRRKPRRR
jgi:streptogramin lyase